MSDVSDIALVLTNTTRDGALDTIVNALELLVARYEFGYRSYGENLRLEFEGIDLVSEQGISRFVPSVHSLGRAEIQQLARDEKYFGIMGSLIFPGFDNLVDLQVLLVPTGEPERPACVVFGSNRTSTCASGRTDSVSIPMPPSACSSFASHSGPPVGPAASGRPLWKASMKCLTTTKVRSSAFCWIQRARPV